MGTGTAAPVYAADSTYHAQSFSVCVESTDRLWIACATSGFGGATATPGRFAIVDPSDMSIESWSSGETGTWDGPRRFLNYNPITDTVWMDRTSGTGDKIIKYDSGGTLAFEASMPSNCVGPFVNRATGDVLVVKQDSGRSFQTRWIYTIDASTGALGTQLYDLAAGNIGWIEADSLGRIWFGTSLDSGTFEIRRIASDGTGDTQVWSDSGSGRSVTALTYNSTADEMLVWRRSLQVGGSTRGSVFMVDCGTGSAGSDIAIPETDGTYPLQNATWSIQSNYDPHRDLFWWLRNSNGTGPQYEGNDVYTVAVAFDPATFAVVHSIPVAYLGPEVDTAPFHDNPGNDFISPYDAQFNGIVTMRAGLRVYWASSVELWDDDASTYIDMQFIQWWESDAAPASRRYAILNVIARRR